ncbi:hypothetical protein K0M31_013674 [Melipona bicolor]|uniref:Uncharacterized protein n=1 Tax=Melipona bicolor TaxID=60889 RepID=A0AA40KGD4_9HYME|nr:hypothetical protein K0M31_013674 [Melipona bicolor]
MRKLAESPSKYIPPTLAVFSSDPLASILGRIRGASRFTDRNSCHAFALSSPTTISGLDEANLKIIIYRGSSQLYRKASEKWGPYVYYRYLSRYVCCVDPYVAWSASSITEIVGGLTPPTESGSKGFLEETNDCYISLSYALAITLFISSSDQAAETGNCIQFVDHYKWQCPSEARSKDHRMIDEISSIERAWKEDMERDTRDPEIKNGGH